MLYYLSNIKELYQTLELHYFKKEIAKYKYDSVVNNLIIIEPFRIDNKYSTISPIWKNYLAINSPNTKLIIMGFMDFQSRNYIDLFHLPKDFEKYLENAFSVSEDWEIPIDGADILEYIKSFFRGHGGNSVLSKLNSLRQTFNIAYTQIANKETTFNKLRKELLLPYSKPEWQELINRWESYYPYFEYLPFYPTIQKIDKSFIYIKQLFYERNITEQTFLESQIDIKLKEIYRELQQIDKLYIRPEIYGSHQEH